eukprot:NODE_8839_length_1466_cov_7.377894.p1 GENE.NODE_8839_length_1466_cov_7.377894~~NODE_8839_length_1466_cov_7.377894.p1  ORF type:complete len:388 (+),score=123.74 NODE_8839_length_1466_cov_7.377894:115-1278(+)
MPPTPATSTPLSPEAIAARAEERECLEAMYGASFEASGDAEWCVRFADGRAALHVSLPDGYPAELPLYWLEAEGGLPHALAKSIGTALLDCRIPGESCLLQWAGIAEEALQQHLEQQPAGGGRGDAGTAAAAELGGSVGSVAAANTGAAEVSAGVGAVDRAVPLAPAVAEAVGASLASAGFEDCHYGIFMHGGLGVTVELSDTLSITVDGIATDDLADWVELQLQSGNDFGPQLIDWTTAQRSAEPGFLEDDEAEPTGSAGIDFLPSPTDLNVSPQRIILLYTWGKAIRKSPPSDSQFTFNASVLNGKGGGADIRTQNGLCEEIQRNVASCALFPRWLEMVTSKIEGANLQCVSIVCTKGRHRSVAAAEILRKLFYRNASVSHLTIY